VEIFYLFSCFQPWVLYRTHSIAFFTSLYPLSPIFKKLDYDLTQTFVIYLIPSKFLVFIKMLYHLAFKSFLSYNVLCPPLLKKLDDAIQQSFPFYKTFIIWFVWHFLFHEKFCCSNPSCTSGHIIFFPLFKMLDYALSRQTVFYKSFMISIYLQFLFSKQLSLKTPSCSILQGLFRYFTFEPLSLPTSLIEKSCFSSVIISFLPVSIGKKNLTPTIREQG